MRRMVIRPKLPAVKGFVEVEWGAERLYQEIDTGVRYRPGQLPEKQSGEKEDATAVWEALDKAYQEGVDSV